MGKASWLVEGGIHGALWLWIGGGQNNGSPCHYVNPNILTHVFRGPQICFSIWPLLALIKDGVW